MFRSGCVTYRVHNFVQKIFNSTKSHVDIVEVGPRDGLQYEKVILPTEIKADLINRLSETGIKRIECSSFVNSKLVPQLSDAEALFSIINRRKGVRYSALVPNVRGLQLAIASNVEEIAIFGAASEAFSMRNINCSITESLRRFQEVLQFAKGRDVSVRGYVSCVIGCPYAGPTDPKVVEYLTKSMLDLGCFEVSLGDTIGIGTPDSIGKMLETVLKSCDAKRLALHCHDTNGMALSNIAKAIDMGIKVFDSSIGGLGGCPFAGPTASGNVATEKVVDYLAHNGLLPDDIDIASIKKVARWITEVLKDSKSAE